MFCAVSAALSDAALRDGEAWYHGSDCIIGFDCEYKVRSGGVSGCSGSNSLMRKLPFLKCKAIESACILNVLHLPDNESWKLMDTICHNRMHRHSNGLAKFELNFS